ncbi:MAG: hypothetical protein GY927_07385 [bacterium]|nr:hypothetical protein [bacterium]
MTATFFEYLGWVTLSPNLKESFNKALLDAQQNRHGTVEIEHLLFALIDDPEGAIVLTERGLDRDDLREKIADHLDELPIDAKLEAQDLRPARELKKLMAKASDQADNEHDDHIDGGDVIRALADFETANSPDFLNAKPNKQDRSRTSARNSRTRSRKSTRQSTPVLQNKEDTMANTPINQTNEDLDFDVDPIRASIKSIMARRRDAEEILFECEWYHLFKSLNMIDEVLEGEEQTQRTMLLARAEKELAERPRCRKAFLYVRHLDQELARLKGIVDIDLISDITPDEAVSELARLRALPRDTNGSTPLNPQSNTSHRSTIGKHLIDVKIQESEVLALEQKLARLDRSSGFEGNHLKELESNLQTHDTHSKKRENVIGVLEHYLHSEMQLSDARDLRIAELEKELLESKSVSDKYVNKNSHLEHELAAFKEHAGNREKTLSELEAKLKTELQSASSHELQVNKLRSMLATEKERGQSHDKIVEGLQQNFEKENNRAAIHEEQVRNLEENMKTRMDQLHLREAQVKKLEEDLSTYESKGDQHTQELHTLTNTHQSEVRKLVTRYEDQDAENRIHQQEINALRAQLADMESRLQDQETAYSVEKVALSGIIDQMRKEIEDSKNLVEVIRAGEAYTVNSDRSSGQNSPSKIGHRITIPVAVKPK